MKWDKYDEMSRKTLWRRPSNEFQGYLDQQSPSDLKAHKSLITHSVMNQQRFATILKKKIDLFTVAATEPLRNTKLFDFAQKCRAHSNMKSSRFPWKLNDGIWLVTLVLSVVPVFFLENYFRWRGDSNERLNAVWPIYSVCVVTAAKPCM